MQRKGKESNLSKDCFLTEEQMKEEGNLEGYCGIKGEIKKKS